MTIYNDGEINNLEIRCLDPKKWALGKEKPNEMVSINILLQNILKFIWGMVNSIE
jgi:hypothetical protein